MRLDASEEKKKKLAEGKFISKVKAKSPDCKTPEIKPARRPVGYI